MPSKSKCRLCGGDVFNADISSGIITCVRCGQQYSMGAGKKEQPQPQPQRSTQTSPMTDTSSPSDFKIANGVLRKYTGNSKHIVIPEGVVKIEGPQYGSVFNTTLESVVLPKSLKVIGYGVFKYRSIKRIDIPYGVTEIGSNAFSNCTSLQTIEIPASVLKIGTGAFSECKSLDSVILNHGLQKIENRAFQRCENLTSITIPDSVVDIECNPGSYASYPFEGCYMLTQISYPKRFSPIVFRGTAWHEQYGEALEEQYEADQRNQRIANGICPKCGKKLNMFKKCPWHGKNY